MNSILFSNNSFQNLASIIFIFPTVSNILKLSLSSYRIFLDRNNSLSYSIIFLLLFDNNILRKDRFNKLFLSLSSPTSAIPTHIDSPIAIPSLVIHQNISPSNLRRCSISIILAHESKRTRTQRWNDFSAQLELGVYERTSERERKRERERIH